MIHSKGHRRHEAVEGRVQEERRVLALAPNWLGDMVMVLPALWALKKGLNDAECTVYLPRDLVDLLDPRAFKTLPRQGSETIAQQVSQIREGHYGFAVIFLNSFRGALLPFLARIPERVGYRAQGRGILLNRAAPEPPAGEVLHESERFMGVVRRLIPHAQTRPPTLRAPVEDRLWAERLFSDTGVRGQDLVIGLFPGAQYGPAKRWLPERFAQLGRMLSHQLGARVLLLGGAEERALVGQLSLAIGDRCLDLSGKTTLGRLMAVLERCQVLVSNDTGPMHLAAALGTHVVAIFGSTDPLRTGPLGPSLVIKHPMTCSPCFKRHCPLDSYACLKRIPVDQVYEGVQDLLMRRPISIQGRRCESAKDFSLHPDLQ
jgi:heptosyltransferase-2